MAGKGGGKSTAATAKQAKPKEKEYDEHDLAHQAKLKEDEKKRKEMAAKIKSGKKG